MLRTFQIAHEFSNMTVLENLMVVPGNQNGESLVYSLMNRKKIAIEFLSCLSLVFSYYENRSIFRQSIVRWDNSHRLHKETASLKRQDKTEKGQNHSMYGRWNDTRRDFYGIEM